MVELKYYFNCTSFGRVKINDISIIYSQWCCGKCTGINFAFNKLTDHGVKECKRHDSELEKLQRARDEWDRVRMKRLDLINERLRERNEARAYIKTVDEAMLEYYRLFAKKIKPLPPEPELSDFYHPSETPKNGELLFVVVGTGIATYALYKHLK